MRTGQDYMRKASSILLSKPSESESNEDIIQPSVCYLFIFLYCLYIFIFFHS